MQNYSVNAIVCSFVSLYVLANATVAVFYVKTTIVLIFFSLFSLLFFHFYFPQFVCKTHYLFCKPLRLLSFSQFSFIFFAWFHSFFFYNSLKVCYSILGDTINLKIKMWHAIGCTLNRCFVIIYTFSTLIFESSRVSLILLKLVLQNWWT